MSETTTKLARLEQEVISEAQRWLRTIRDQDGDLYVRVVDLPLAQKLDQLESFERKQK